MKTIYFYDAKTKKYAGMDIIADDAQVPENATTVELDSTLLDAYWDGQAWQGVTQEEFNKNHPSTPPEGWEDTPSELDKLKARQDATEQAVQDLILASMSVE